jgi:sn-glycerol 3-phosphate transport system substrate-binding protein
MRKTILAAAATLSLLMSSVAFAEPTEINLWHSHPSDSTIGKTVAAIADKFNQKQDQYKVIATYKGTYYETLNAAIAAYRAKKQPPIIQVLGNLTLTMMLSNATVPVQKLMEDSGYKIDWDNFIPPVISMYRDPSGQAASMPFSASTPVLWYNVDAFEKAGIEKAPTTWDEVGEASRKLRAAGYECGFTISWQIYTQIESYSFANDIPLATKANGMAGYDVELVFNKTKLVDHIAQLQEWAKEGLFTYAGRTWQGAHESFYSQKCQMFIESSAGYAGIKSNSKFRFNATAYPSEPGIEQHNTALGGGSLYVMKGFDDDVYKGAAAFFAYLAEPDTQLFWHQNTGYVPITKAAYELAKEKGYYKENPIQQIPLEQLLRGTPTDNSKGFRVGDYGKITDIIDEELENIWSQKKTAQQGLDDAVARGNEVLRRFARTVKQ